MIGNFTISIEIAMWFFCCAFQFAKRAHDGVDESTLIFRIRSGVFARELQPVSLIDMSL